MDVSIIIPTYNRLWCLPRAIESCRNTACKTEIIVVDDGSTDGTWEWLQQQLDLVSIRQPNLGKCWAANRAFATARGKYIKFLDSDDLLESNSIDEQFELAEEMTADVVVSGYQTFIEDSAIIKKQLWIETNDFIAQQLGECDSSHYSAYLFKKSFINDVPHRPDFAFRDDRLFVLEVALKNPQVIVHGGTALLHRIGHTDRLQVPYGLKQCVQNWQHVGLYRFIIGQLQEQDKLTQRRKKAACTVLWPLAHWIAIYNIPEAAKLVEWIFELDPDFIIPQKGPLGFLYRNIGFSKTEHLLRLRRILKGSA